MNRASMKKEPLHPKVVYSTQCLISKLLALQLSNKNSLSTLFFCSVSSSLSLEELLYFLFLYSLLVTGWESYWVELSIDLRSGQELIGRFLHTAFCMRCCCHTRKNLLLPGLHAHKKSRGEPVILTCLQSTWQLHVCHSSFQIADYLLLCRLLFELLELAAQCCLYLL